MSAPRDLWPEPWASRVFAEADATSGQLKTALANRRQPSILDRTVCELVEGLLEDARNATRSYGRRRRALRDWWRGTSLERSHYYLHAAKTMLVDVLDEPAIDAEIPGAVARVMQTLPAADVRRAGLEALLTQHGLPLLEKRARLKVALQLGYKASDQTHARVRGFRNLIYIVGVVVLLFMVVVVSVSAAHPTWASLCFEPAITSAAAPGQPPPDAATTVTACPSGDEVGRRPAREDVGIVAGLGLVGGSLAAVFAIRKVRGSSTPYDLPLAAAFLKVPTGALTAVAGMLLLGGGFVPGLSALDSQRQILAYALLLGYAQQLATQLVDKQAQNVLGAVPSKEARPAPQPQAASLGSSAPNLGPTLGSRAAARPTWVRRALGRRRRTSPRAAGAS